MAIVANRTTEVGDVILIEVDVPLVGLTALVDFTDTVVGDTATRYFNKRFRYQADGINWSSWIDLTVANIQAVNTDPSSPFKIEYRYERVGDPLGELRFDDATLEATRQFPPAECGPTYKDSVFNRFFDCMDNEVMQWCLNVLEKLYRSGIVPQYITRGGTSNLNAVDKDYIDFWRTIACYFALFVKYARTFESFRQDDFLLREYLKNRGMFLCDETEYLDLLHLMNHFWDEIRQRGTQLMLIPKGTTLSDGRVKEADGEFLRLICWHMCDEFIFSLTEPENTSWTVNSGSPLFTGLHKHANVVRGYAKNAGAMSDLPQEVDLAEYPLHNSGAVSVVNDTDNDGGAIEAISVSSGGVTSGIGLPHNTPVASVTDDQWNKAIVMDPCLDYEVTFWVKHVSGTGTIDFTMNMYNETRSYGPYRHMSAYLGGPYRVSFFEGLDITDLCAQTGKWYLVRGILFGLYSPLKFSSDRNAFVSYDSNIGFHLHQSRYNFYYGSACKGLPGVSTDVAGNVRIANFAVRPLKTPHSVSFINLNKWINIWANNNNGEYTKSDIDQIVRQYLIPYDTQFKINWDGECRDCIKTFEALRAAQTNEDKERLSVLAKQCYKKFTDTIAPKSIKSYYE